MQTFHPFLWLRRLGNTCATRFVVPSIIFAAALILGAVLRIALLLRADRVAIPLMDTIMVFISGALFDAVTAIYLVLPLALVLALLPQRWLQSRPLRALAIVALGACFYLLLFVAVSEWVFWDEFGARFNFIAVDYLVYTHEVLGNIRESYPVGTIAGGLALLALCSGLLFARLVWARMQQAPDALPRWLAALVPLALASAATVFVSANSRPAFNDELALEVSGNGIYQFFSAFRHNTLDYPRFFATIPQDDATARLRGQLTSAGEFWPERPLAELERIVLDPQPEQRLNIVLVSVESLGSEFLGALGNDKGLTPNLDRLAGQSLFFTNVFATGNRTVRGLEALSLSIPPTPGESIVKRPGAQQLFTLGAVLEDKGYDSMFLYGGYGYFDNMNEFFSKNDYRVVDRTQIPKDRIHYENIWGVADEDLFEHALSELDGAHAQGKPFFAHIMTTSNHRPYTYPEGRIDIPSGSGRDGAVKYTDYALGRFLDSAKGHAWFQRTIFVLTADHGASARGTMDIPVEQYRIPLMIYAPGRIAPERVDRLMSQIDIPPTILGRLHMSYRTKFFGRDIFRSKPAGDRAFVATYQTLGYIREGQLVSLSPQRRVRVTPMLNGRAADAATRERLTSEAIAWYETAQRLYQSRQFSDDDANRDSLRLSMGDVKREQE